VFEVRHCKATWQGTGGRQSGTTMKGRQTLGQEARCVQWPSRVVSETTSMDVVMENKWSWKCLKRLLFSRFYSAHKDQAAFWDVASCILVEVGRRLTLMMEAVHTYKTYCACT
jgi:hypothetical protein